MSFSREEALNILQLSEGYDSAQLDAAFRKLSRRYPPQVFPEKFQKIRSAVDYLADISMSSQAILTHESIDTSWLEPFLKPAAAWSDIGTLTDPEFLSHVTRLMMQEDFLDICEDKGIDEDLLDADFDRGSSGRFHDVDLDEDAMEAMAEIMQRMMGGQKRPRGKTDRR